MRTIRAISFIAALFVPSLSIAQSHEHGSAIFHAITVEASANQVTNENSIDLDSWIGGDFKKLWLKANVDTNNQKWQGAQIEAYYSKNIATFWDLQIGMRHDFATDTDKANSYAGFGFNGLAPYFFETEAHVFIDEKGLLSARFHQSNEILITNKLIAEPFIKANFRQNQKSNFELGLQTRYEISRKIAPFLEFNYSTSVEKARKSENSIALGVRLLF